MKKKLDTRFPAARIKKIMQSDDDVGKIAMAVPLLVSKALELFLQDLCDRTYQLTSTRGVKTVTSLHLKQCVQSFNIFDFLRDTVSRVPDPGDSALGSEDRPVGKKRKLADFEDEKGGSKETRTKTHDAAHTANSDTKARGRGRGRGRGGSRTIETDRFEDDLDMNDLLTLGQDDETEPVDTKANTVSTKNTQASVRNFDLNLDLDETGDYDSVLAVDSNDTAEATVKETVDDEPPSWSCGVMETLQIDPMIFGVLNHRMEGFDDDDDENYDVED